MNRSRTIPILMILKTASPPSFRATCPVREQSANFFTILDSENNSKIGAFVPRVNKTYTKQSFHSL